MRKLILLISIVLLLLLSGCNKTISVDYISLNDDYLDYSLGDWKVVSKTQGQSSLVGTTYYDKWIIEYSCKDNEKREFYLDNFSNEFNTIEHLGFLVQLHAEEIAKAQLENEILKKYFKEDEIGVLEHMDNSSKTSAFFLLDDALSEDEEKAYYKKIGSTENGIKLREVNALSLLKTNPSYIIEFCINSDLTDPQDIDRIRNIRDLVINDLIEYLGDYGIIIAEIDWGNIPDKDVYDTDVKYFAYGKEIPDDMEKRRELNCTPVGYIKEAITHNNIKIKGVNN